MGPLGTEAGERLPKAVTGAAHTLTGALSPPGPDPSIYVHGLVSIRQGTPPPTASGATESGANT